MVLLANGTAWWSTFPWQAVGASVSLILLALGGLRLASTWGTFKEQLAEHGRKIDKLEGKADGVPEAVDHEVTNKNKFLEGAVSRLSHKLGQLYKAARHLKRHLDEITKRCQKEHGALPELHPDQIDDVLSAPPDTDEEGGSDDAKG